MLSVLLPLVSTARYRFCLCCNEWQRGLSVEFRASSCFGLCHRISQTTQFFASVTISNDLHRKVSPSKVVQTIVRHLAGEPGQLIRPRLDGWFDVEQFDLTLTGSCFYLLARLTSCLQYVVGHGIRQYRSGVTRLNGRLQQLSQHLRRKAEERHL